MGFARYVSVYQASSARTQHRGVWLWINWVNRFKNQDSDTCPPHRTTVSTSNAEGCRFQTPLSRHEAMVKSLCFYLRAALVIPVCRAELLERSDSHPSARSPAHVPAKGSSPGSLAGHRRPRGPPAEPGRPRPAPQQVARPGPLSVEVPGRWPGPRQGGVGQPRLPKPLAASPHTAASPLCELRRVYPPTSLFHSAARAINRPAGTAEPSAARAGGKGGRGMAASPLPHAGRAVRVPPWWLGAQPFP